MPNQINSPTMEEKEGRFARILNEFHFLDRKTSSKIRLTLCRTEREGEIEFFDRKRGKKSKKSIRIEGIKRQRELYRFLDSRLTRERRVRGEGQI